MAIAVNCGCGKKFKVKDHLAGKAVRCPACKGPLHIPAIEPKSKGTAQKSAPEEAASQTDKEKALLKFDQAQAKKQHSAEADAAYAEERNKLIAAYDQMAGKKASPKKKAEAAPGKPKKAGFFTKLADVLGAIAGTLVFKYVMIALLVSGGTVGSIYLVKFVTGYIGQQTKPTLSLEEQVNALFAKTEEAIKAKKWGEANQYMMEILTLAPRQENMTRWKNLKAQIDKGSQQS